MRALIFVLFFLSVVSVFGVCSIKKPLNCEGDTLRFDFVESTSENQVEIVIPCSDMGRSDYNFFRADASSENIETNESKEKAKENVKKRLLMLIGARLNVIHERYVNEMVSGANDDYKQKLENLVSDVVKQLLSDAKTTCEKTMKTKEGKFQTFSSMELSREALLNGLHNKISNDAKLKDVYAKVKYQQIFNEELKKVYEE